jgi:hypothetical protein
MARMTPRLDALLEQIIEEHKQDPEYLAMSPAERDAAIAEVWSMAERTYRIDEALKQGDPMGAFAAALGLSLDDIQEGASIPISAERLAEARELIVGLIAGPGEGIM